MSEAALAASLAAQRRPGAVVAGVTGRKAVRSGLIWGYVFGFIVAATALSYSSIYKTQAERDHLAASFGSNKASSALFGPALQLQTVAGFTVFKISMTTMLVGAVWGLLTSTRLLRGEEDAGRWELLLTGETTRSGGALQALAGLGAGGVTLYLLTAVLTVISGRSSIFGISVSSGLFFALALVSTAFMFLAVGALTSQLAATRRQAAAYAATFLGLSYGVRMIADSGIGLHGLIWLSPLGWVEELQPLTGSRPLPLLPIAAFTIVAGAAAVHLAGRRDLASSILPDRDAARARVGLLSGPTGLAARLLRPTIIGWAVGIAASGFLMGIIAKAAGTTIAGSSVEKVFTRLGAPGTGAAPFLGVTFLLLALLLGFVAAGHVTAARSEEAEERIDHLLSRPVSRSWWLGGRLLLALAVLVAFGLLAGVATWVGAAAQGSGVAISTMLGAGANIVPPALVLLGAGALAIGIVPRASTAVVYGLLGWSLLVEIVGGVGTTSRFLLDTSVFHQMASAPAVHPNWAVNGVMIGIGVLTALAGVIAFRRRDLQGA